VGRIFQHGPFMLTAYMFPKAAFLHSRQESVRPLLKRTLVFTLWIVGASLLLCTAFRAPVVRLLFGSQYAQAADLLPWYALAASPMAFNWVLANGLLAVGRTRFLWGMALSVAVYGTGLALVHRSAWDLLAVLAASGLTMMAWNLWEILGRRK
jgi:O-antigen/teichoic acid export membrane protein